MDDLAVSAQERSNAREGAGQADGQFVELTLVLMLRGAAEHAVVNAKLRGLLGQAREFLAQVEPPGFQAAMDQIDRPRVPLGQRIAGDAEQGSQARTRADQQELLLRVVRDVEALAEGAADANVIALDPPMQPPAHPSVRNLADVQLEHAVRGQAGDRIAP